MNILCMTHANFELPEVIENEAQDNNPGFSICESYRGKNCLSTDDFDLLIMMSGAQSLFKIEKDLHFAVEIKPI